MTEMLETSVARSFRLSRTTSDLLDDLAAVSSESRNALADRLLGEALRTERHPLISFRTGAAGRREPFLVGTRMMVRQVIATVKDHGNDVEVAADYLAVGPSMVRAAVSYFADFRAEIEADTEWAMRIEANERARWEREQAALA
jgi:uncharacterized protein (DUF433 family)